MGCRLPGEETKAEPRRVHKTAHTVTQILAHGEELMDRHRHREPVRCLIKCPLNQELIGKAGKCPVCGRPWDDPRASGQGNGREN